MRSILEILMDRDGMSREDAKELITTTREEINNAIDCGDYSLVEDIMAYNLGLEMDYAFQLIGIF